MKLTLTNTLGLILITTFAASACVDEAEPNTDGTVLHSEVSNEDLLQPNRRHRIASLAQEALDRLPDEPTNSDDPLDVAVSDGLMSTAELLRTLTGAPTMTKAELRTSIKSVIEQGQDDAENVGNMLASTAENPVGPMDGRSCSKRCLDEWQGCLLGITFEDGTDPQLWAGSFMCAITLEVCFADCLLPG